MTNWFRFLSGTVRVRVRCASPERVLNLCARENLPVWEARCPEPCTLTAVIPAPKLERFSALAAKCGGEVTCGAARGLPRVRSLARRRRFVLILLVLVSALVLLSSAFLWEIRVTGNETVPTGTILRALDECGFSCGKCWLWFQSQALQSELIYRLPQLEWVSFQIRGSRADVIVYESESAPEVGAARRLCRARPDADLRSGVRPSRRRPDGARARLSPRPHGLGDHRRAAENRPRPHADRQGKAPLCPRFREKPPEFRTNQWNSRCGL